MKTSEAKEKKFRELSDEELQNVTGGAKLPITPIAQGDEVELARVCGIKICPPGYKLDTSLQPCQCVEEPNAGQR